MKLSAEVQMFAIALILITFLAITLAVVALRDIPQEDDQAIKAQTPDNDQLPIAEQTAETE